MSGHPSEEDIMTELNEKEKEEKIKKIRETLKILQRVLLKRISNLEGISPPGHFRESGPAIGQVNLEYLGYWLWIKARFEYEGATWDPSTDRLKGDPYSAHAWRDWIGQLKTAPVTLEPSSPEQQLDEWAILKTEYLREYTDVGVWGRHSGEWVEELQEDGTVTLRIASGVFHDVPPISTTETKEVQLNKLLELRKSSEREG